MTVKIDTLKEVDEASEVVFCDGCQRHIERKLGWASGMMYKNSGVVINLAHIS